MPLCHQTTNHNLSQCWPRSMSPYGVTRSDWDNTPSDSDDELWNMLGPRSAITSLAPRLGHQLDHLFRRDRNVICIRKTNCVKLLWQDLLDAWCSARKRNRQPYECLLNDLFSRIWQKPWKLRVTDLCAVNSPQKWPVTRKMFPFDDVIMFCMHVCQLLSPICFNNNNNSRALLVVKWLSLDKVTLRRIQPRSHLLRMVVLNSWYLQ